jgi:hypothetical protein
MKTLPHFSQAVLVHDGGLIIGAGLADPAVIARLTVGYITGAKTLLDKVAGDKTGQKGKKGALGGLTIAQTQAVKILQHWMNEARETAKLAFPGQTVKLHQAFAVGNHDKFDLASFLERADTILASVQSPDNLPALQARGWTDTETQAFITARAAFGPAELFRKQSISGAIDATTLSHTDAAELYDEVLTIQRAANLQYPALDPANAGTREKYLLNTFPPAGGGHNSTTTTTTTTATPATTPAPATPSK